MADATGPRQRRGKAADDNVQQPEAEGDVKEKMELASLEEKLARLVAEKQSTGVHVSSPMPRRVLRTPTGFLNQCRPDCCQQLRRHRSRRKVVSQRPSAVHPAPPTGRTTLFVLDSGSSRRDALSSSSPSTRYSPSSPRWRPARQAAPLENSPQLQLGSSHGRRVRTAHSNSLRAASEHQRERRARGDACVIFTVSLHSSL